MAGLESAIRRRSVAHNSVMQRNGDECWRYQKDACIDFIEENGGWGGRPRSKARQHRDWLLVPDKFLIIQIDRASRTGRSEHSVAALAHLAHELASFRKTIRPRSKRQELG